MIAVLVREQDAIELLRCHGAMLQTQRQLSRAQAAIDQKLAMIGRDQRAVSRASAAEHRQAEHGSQDSRVTSTYANRNQGIIATVVLPKRREDARALQSFRETEPASLEFFARSTLE